MAGFPSGFRPFVSWPRSARTAAESGLRSLFVGFEMLNAANLEVRYVHGGGEPCV
jgi:hypothetical protein